MATGETFVVHDVLIIGAGPCGLAVAARLCEPAPSAVFTDEEARRFSWIRNHAHRTTIRNSKTGKDRPAHGRDALTQRPSIHVLDEESGSWMARWKRYFQTFGISQLRSPMFWHVDPQDRDALLSWSYFNERQDELNELKNCVGLELSKHARKRRIKAKHTDGDLIDHRQKHDYYTPSQALFVGHCEHIAERYGLKDDAMIEQARVTDIKFDFVHDLPGTESDDKIFTVTTDGGEVHYARIVVLAVGPANTATMPASIVNRAQFPPGIEMPQVCHSMKINKTFPDALVRERISQGRQTNILIVGGGLTSAQLADLAIKRGVTRVWLITRGPWRTRLFDVDLEWMGKFRNREHSVYHGLETDRERLDLYRQARAGGSIPAYYQKVLAQHEKRGSLCMQNHTRIDTPASQLCFDNASNMWAVKTDPPMPNMPRMDYIYFATGVQSSCETLPYLQSMRQQYPIDFEGGFPCLTDDLMWSEGVPLFFNGRLAALRIGPAAPNLGGARVGAERIAWQVEKMLEGRQTEESKHDERLAYFKGQGNPFACLAEHRNPSSL